MVSSANAGNSIPTRLMENSTLAPWIRTRNLLQIENGHDAVVHADAAAAHTPLHSAELTVFLDLDNGDAEEECLHQLVDDVLPTLQSVDAMRDRIQRDLSNVRDEIDSLQSWYQQYSERIANAVLAGFFTDTRTENGAAQHRNSGALLVHGSEDELLNYSSTESRSHRNGSTTAWGDLHDIPIRRFSFPSSSGRLRAIHASQQDAGTQRNRHEDFINADGDRWRRDGIDGSISLGSWDDPCLVRENDFSNDLLGLEDLDSNGNPSSDKRFENHFMKDHFDSHPFAARVTETIGR